MNSFSAKQCHLHEDSGDTLVVTEHNHQLPHSNIISNDKKWIPQSTENLLSTHFRSVITLRNVGVFNTVYQGECKRPLPSSPSPGF